MAKLTLDQIELLASRANVHKTAVENFLMTLDGLTREESIINLVMDAQCYDWNEATVRAIKDGILLAMK